MDSALQRLIPTKTNRLRPNARPPDTHAGLGVAQCKILKSFYDIIFHFVGEKLNKLSAVAACAGKKKKRK